MRPEPAEAAVPGEHPFARYVRTLGRGPGRSRALTRDEARQALPWCCAARPTRTRSAPS